MLCTAGWFAGVATLLSAFVAGFIDELQFHITA
jgi:hypothetical protein